MNAVLPTNSKPARFERVVWPAGLLLGTMAFLAIVIMALGGEPVQAFSEFFSGVTGLRGLGAIAARGTILLLYALGISLSFQAGIINIGAEGQSRLGAAAAVAMTLGTFGSLLKAQPLIGIPLLLFAGAMGGAFWALLSGGLRLWRGVSEVVSTLLLNFAAMPLVKFLVSNRAWLQGNTNFQKNELAPALQLYGWLGTEFHAGVFCAIPAFLIAHFFLFNTASGLRLRASGLNNSAAKACGVNTSRVTLWTFAISGALAGLAGAMSVMATGALETRPAYPEYGYMAVSVALVAGLKPLWVAPSALLFAAMEVGAASMEEGARVPHWIVFLLHGILILAILARNSLTRDMEGAGA